MQIHADTAGLPVRTTGSKGRHPWARRFWQPMGRGILIRDAGIAAMVKPGEVFTPNPTAMAQYAPIYEKYEHFTLPLKKSCRISN